MYRIEEQRFGFLITFSGAVQEGEAVVWYRESERRLSTNVNVPFCVMVDMRQVQSFPPGMKSIIIEGQKLYLGKGMHRSVVIVNDASVMKQCKYLAKASGIYEKERYIDVRKDANWVNTALLWIREGVLSEQVIH